MSDESTSSAGGSNEYSLFPRIDREDIQIEEQLGTGSFGCVFKGRWNQAGVSKVVAVKKVFVLEKEAEILSKIRHKFIIEFHGICKSGSDFYIVTEYAPNGSLYDHLHGEKAVEISFATTLRWATEVASGINYLHSDGVVSIIHRDLKSKNVVLGDKLRCKICDFGTSKDLTHSCTAPTWGGTAAWMSPEIINQNEGLTTAADVWSYGVVLWEMLSREVPYRDFTEFRIYTLITQQGVTLVIPESCPPQLANLMRGCWVMNPKSRLTMKDVLDELSKMEHSSKIKDDCQTFLDNENWREQIEAQKKEVDEMRKSLEKQKERLDARERALLKRVKMEAALIESSNNFPEDVYQWSEHHSANWLARILSRVVHDSQVLDKVKASVFRHRITGARLLEMTQKDLDHLGVDRLGNRMEVTKNIRRLKDDHCRFINFPTLEHAHRLHLLVKSEKENGGGPVSTTTSLILLLGMYQRSAVANQRRFKFYVDADWADDPSSSSHSPSTLIKSVCFSVLDSQNNKPLNEPTCYPGPSCVSMDWLTMTDTQSAVKVIVNVHYSDNVSEPRSTEMMAMVTHFDRPAVLIERTVPVKIRRKSTSVTTPLSAQSPPPHLMLRGAWVRKATETRHALTDSRLSVINSQPKLSLWNDDVMAAVTTDNHNNSDNNNQSSQPTKRKPRKKTKSATEIDRNPSVLGGKSKFAWKSQQKRNL